MTAERKRRLRQKLQASRERLLTLHPSLAILLMYLRFVATPHVRKMSTNGRCIFFSADYLDRLYHSEVDFLLCHQILHIAFDTGDHPRHGAETLSGEKFFAPCTKFTIYHTAGNIQHIAETRNFHLPRARRRDLRAPDDTGTGIFNGGKGVIIFDRHGTALSEAQRTHSGSLP